MKTDHPDHRIPTPDLAGAGHGLRIAVICARFNSHITIRLLDGVNRGLAPTRATAEHRWVPGAFEIPLAAKTFAETGHIDAVIGIGCVIRGETAHFEHVAGQCRERFPQHPRNDRRRRRRPTLPSHASAGGRPRRLHCPVLPAAARLTQFRLEA